MFYLVQDPRISHYIDMDKLMFRYQIDHQEPHYPGIPFMELYTQCRADFLVTSDLELKAQVKLIVF